MAHEIETKVLDIDAVEIKKKLAGLGAEKNRSIEELHHFTCSKCRKWWSIGDAPKRKKEWFCPWCGEKQKFTSN